MVLQGKDRRLDTEYNMLMWCLPFSCLFWNISRMFIMYLPMLTELEPALPERNPTGIGTEAQYLCVWEELGG